MDGIKAAAIAAEERDWQVDTLKKVPASMLLGELSRRGGALGALGDAGLLALRKGGDYNGTERPPGDERDAYFPFGEASYAQMLWVKAQRAVQLVRNKPGQVPSFEGLIDTCLDIINYASFFVDWLRRKRG